MTPDIVPVKNALLSVYYKSGIVDMARILHDAGVSLISSGGTADEIRKADLPVTDVTKYTGFPTLFGHRVATLHPKIHGGILYRRDNEKDVAEAQQYDIESIDLVVVNLYPVHEAIGKPGATLDEVIEKTDIGGPALIRAAAKNHKHVAVVVDPNDYLTVARVIKDSGGLSLGQRQTLALKAFETTATYDRAIADFYKKTLG